MSLSFKKEGGYSVLIVNRFLTKNKHTQMKLFSLVTRNNADYCQKVSFQCQPNEIKIEYFEHLWPKICPIL